MSDNDLTIKVGVEGVEKFHRDMESVGESADRAAKKVASAGKVHFKLKAGADFKSLEQEAKSSIARVQKGFDSLSLKRVDESITALSKTISGVGTSAERLTKSVDNIGRASVSMLSKIEAQTKAVNAGMSEIERSSTKKFKQGLLNDEFSRALVGLRNYQDGIRNTTNDLNQMLKVSQKLATASRVFKSSEDAYGGIQQSLGSRAANYIKHHPNFGYDLKAAIAAHRNEDLLKKQQASDEKLLQAHLKRMDERAALERVQQTGKFKAGKQSAKAVRYDAVRARQRRAAEDTDDNRNRRYSQSMRLTEIDLQGLPASIRALTKKHEALRVIESDYQRIKGLKWEVHNLERQRFEKTYGTAAFSEEASAERQRLMAAAKSRASQALATHNEGISSREDQRRKKQEAAEAKQKSDRFAYEQTWSKLLDERDRKVAKTLAKEASMAQAASAQRVNIERLNREYDVSISKLRTMLELRQASSKEVLRSVEKLALMERDYQTARNMPNGVDRATAYANFHKRYGSAASTASASKARQQILDAAQAYTPYREFKASAPIPSAAIKSALEDSKKLNDLWRGMAAASGNIWLSWGGIKGAVGMATGLAVGSTLFKSLETAREYGWQITQMGIAAEASDVQLKDISKSILEINQAGSLQGPIQMAEALRVLAQAGLNAEESMSNLRTVLDFALVSGVSDEQSATFLSGLRSAFDLKSQSALREGADQTARAAQVSQTSIEAMSEALKQASPEAARFGLSVADTSSMLATLAKYNIEASAAGTATKRFLSDLAGRTPAATKALEKLGLSFYNSEGMVKPFIQVVEEVQVKLRGLTDKKKQEWLKSIFDERGLKVASILLSEDPSVFKKTHAEISRASENGGVTEAQASRLAETSEGAFREMKNAWEGFFISIGSDEEVSKAFQGLMDNLTKLAANDQFREFAKDTATTLMTLANAATAFASSLAPVAPALQNVIVAGGAFKAWQLGGLALGAAKTSLFTSLVSNLNDAKAKYTGVASAASAAASASVPFASATANVATASGVAAGRLGMMANASRLLQAGFTLLTGPVGLLVTLFGSLIYSWLSSETQVKSLTQATAELSSTLGTVPVNRMTEFNDSAKGLGKQLDTLLGTAGMLADHTKNLELLPPQVVSDFQTNLDRINEAVRQVNNQITDNSAQSAKERAEQEVMLADRKISLLREQLTNFDKHTAHINELDEESKTIRENYVRELHNTTVGLMAARTNLAKQQMAELAMEAEQQMSWLEKLWRNITTGFDAKAEEYVKNALAAVENGTATAEQVRAANAVTLSKSAGQAYNAASLGMSYEEAKRIYDGFQQNPQSFNSVIKNKPEETLKVLQQVRAAYGTQLTTLGSKPVTKGSEVIRAKQTADLQGAIRYLDALANNISQSQVKSNSESNKLRTTGGIDRSNPAEYITAKDPKPKRTRAASVPKADRYEDFTKEEAEIRARKASDNLKRLDEERKFAEKYGTGVKDDWATQYASSRKDKLQADYDKVTAGILDELVKLQKGLAEQKYDEVSTPKVQARVKELEQQVLARSAKGTVGIGQTYSKVAVPNDSLESAASGFSSGVSSTGAKAAEFIWKRAGAKAKDYLEGRCAEAVNDGFQALGLKASGDGKDVAANLIAGNKGKFQSIQYSKDYVPQVGDVMSIDSKGKAGQHPAGHVAIYTASGQWASNFKQQKRGNTGAGNETQYKLIQSGQAKVTIARPIAGGVVEVPTAKSSTSKTEYELRAKQKTAVNAANGAEYELLQKQLEAEDKLTEKRKQSVALLSKGYVENKRSLDLQSEQLDRISQVEQADQFIVLSRKLRIELSKQELELQKEIAETMLDQSLTEEQRAAKIAALQKQSQAEREKALQQYYADAAVARKRAMSSASSDWASAAKSGDGQGVIDARQAYINAESQNPYATAASIVAAPDLQSQITSALSQAAVFQDGGLFSGLAEGFGAAMTTAVDNVGNQLTSMAVNGAGNFGQIASTFIQSFSVGLPALQSKLSSTFADMEVFKDGGLLSGLSGPMADAATESVRMIGSELITAAEGGNTSFSEMGRNILKMFAQMIIKALLLKAINTLLGNPGRSANANAKGGVQEAGVNVDANAYGGVYNGGKRLKAYAAGGVVHTPTRFNGGTGLMGENGPEGILPLSRMPNGDLGVQMLGGTGGGVVVSAPVSVTVTVNSDGSSTSEADSNQKFGKELGEQIKAVTLKVISTELRLGGSINNAIKGR